jgi:hypothetical protein
LGSFIGIVRADRSSNEEMQWGSFMGIVRLDRSDTETIECGSFIGIPCGSFMGIVIGTADDNTNVPATAKSASVATTAIILVFM